MAFMHKATLTRHVPKYQLNLVAGQPVKAPAKVLAELEESGLVEKVVTPKRKPKASEEE